MYTVVCKNSCKGIILWVMWQTPVDAFPDTTPLQVQINTNAPALNAAEIEQQITFPVETAISGIPGLLEVDMSGLASTLRDTPSGLASSTAGG